LNVFQLAQTNLALQIIILLTLITAYMFKRQGRLHLHGFLMLAAVILNAVSIALVMVPSLLGLAHVYRNFSPTVLAVITGHAVLGGAVEALGIWLVASWGLGSPLQYCASKRKIMRGTMIAWPITVFLGALTFTLLYLT
jgi:uncharacterized membrane protein YozB (DUF420 family)